MKIVAGFFFDTADKIHAVFCHAQCGRTHSYHISHTIRAAHFGKFHQTGQSTLHRLGLKLFRLKSFLAQTHHAFDSV